MEIIKQGGHLSLAPDETTARIVHDVLADIRDNGIEAIRKYSRQFDSWDPPRFELSQEEINEIADKFSTVMNEYVFTADTGKAVFEVVDAGGEEEFEGP